MEHGLHCSLDNKDFSLKFAQGIWFYPNEEEVDCDSEPTSSNPLSCTLSKDRKDVILYSKSNIEVDSRSPAWNGVYSCCLPGECDDGNTSRVTARIYGKVTSCAKCVRNVMNRFPFCN